MSEKYTKEELLEMPAIEAYKLVLRKDISRFPAGFWQQPEALNNAKLCVRFMIEEILKWNDETIKESLFTKTIVENKLGGMLITVFKNSLYDAINSTYPNRLKRWELKSSVPKNYWTLENGIETTKWLVEEKLKWTDEDIKEKISQKTFKDNNLSGMMRRVFNGSPYDAINTAYPNRFKKEDLKSYQYNVTKK